MFITKRAFFKNKKEMYSTYREHWNNFITSCEVFQDKYAVLERLINEYRDTEYVYKFLSKVKDNVTCLAQYRIACTYQGAESSDMILTWHAYRHMMMSNQGKINRAIGEIDGAIIMCDLIKKHELTLRSK